MDRFVQLRVFVAVAESGGFAAAARRLDMSPPAVTRAVAALEERLGVQLLVRTTRHVRVTDAGQSYLDDARRLLADFAAADEAAAGVDADPRGVLTVTAPAMFGRLFVVPGIVAYLQRYPATEVNALLLDRVVNLIEENVDVAIRIGHLPDSNLRGRRVGDSRLVTCAAPSYVAAHGAPSAPAELARHSLIVAASIPGPVASWRFAGGSGPHTVRVRPRLTVTSNDAAVAAATRGFGITRLLSYQVAAQVAAGELVLILEDCAPPPQPVHIVRPHGRFAAARTRVFIDLMTERLRDDPALRSPG